MKTRNIKIAIVEDDKYYNKVLTKYVGNICNDSFYPDTNFEIKSYRSAHECIENLDKDLDIMILDYFLINLDESDILTGADVVDEVNSYCNNCEIVMISSQESEEIKDSLRAKGITEYVDKNLNSNNRVGAVIQKILNNEEVYAQM